MHTLFTLAIYGILGVQQAANRTNGGVTAKIAVCLVAVVILWDVPGVFNTLFGPLRFLLGFVDPRTPDVEPLHEWQFRTGLDRYVWIYGMACAYCHPAAERALEKLDKLPAPQRAAARVAVLAVATAALGLWYRRVAALFGGGEALEEGRSEKREAIDKER